MPEIPDGMVIVETTILENWKKKMDRVYKKKGQTTRRQYIRDLIYSDLKKEGQM